MGHLQAKVAATSLHLRIVCTVHTLWYCTFFTYGTTLTHLVCLHRLCAQVVESGILSESAIWLAQQLEQGLLCPEACSKLVFFLHALILHAVEGVAQLAGDSKSLEGITEILKKVCHANIAGCEARVGSGGHWQDMALAASSACL